MKHKFHLPDNFTITNDDELYNAIDKLIKATTTSQERKKLNNDELFTLAFDRTLFDIMVKDPETDLFWLLTEIVIYLTDGDDYE